MARQHYDIRLICSETGRREATEEIGLSLVSAQRALSALMDGGSAASYEIVACTRPGSHPIHDVDLDYSTHQREHLGLNVEFVRYVGRPTDDRIQDCAASDPLQNR